MNTPTDEGRRRYPPDGYFLDVEGLFEGDTKEPCTCMPQCPAGCDGQCGCDACRARATADAHYGSQYSTSEGASDP